MKIAVSSYSYSQYIRAGKMTQTDAVVRAAEMGFEGIEIVGLDAKENAPMAEQIAYAEELRRAAETAGIEIVSYMTGGKLYNGDPAADAAEVARIKGQLDVAAVLGAKVLRHDVCYSEQFNGRVVGFERMLPTIAENAREITEYGASLGIRTCTENHGRIAQDSDRMERLYYMVDHENYGLLIDMGNFACADQNSVLSTSRLAPYAIHAHAKDFVIKPYGTKPKENEKYFLSRGCNYLFGCAIGDGDIPVAQCVAILKKAGYDGWISIEFEGNGDCIQEIAKGYANLKAYIEQTI